MTVRPVLQAMVLADHVYRDSATGKHIIAGTFSKILMGESQQVEEIEEGEKKERRFKGPIGSVGSPYLYLALVGIRQKVDFSLQFVDLSNAKVLLSLNFYMQSSDPLSIAEGIIPMPPIVNAIPRASGVYSLDLIWKGEQLGSWRVIAERVSNENPDESK